MGKFYKISIPKPCHEDWNTMTPSEKGRFCDSCAKTVIDFTTMSSLHIQDFLAENKSKKICGHFKKTQLDTIHISIPIHIIKTKHTFKRSFLLALLIVMGTTLVNCTNHDGKQQKIESVELKEVIDTKKNNTFNIDSIPKKCTKNTSLTSTKKKEETVPGFIEVIPEEIIPPPVIPEPIETVEGGIEIVMGDLIASNEIINLNQPIPIHLLDTSPALSKTPIKKRTQENYSKQMKKLITKYFNTDIGRKLGLQGVQRIYVRYEINKDGVIKDIETRAPHPELEKEAKRVLQKIPKLIAGTYKNEPVRTIYHLPIVFKIEE
uniref:TonB C-terminal domain-containing protein n=1 Tax=Aquimarina algiphila TaxID=2047982 RepID=A0A554VJY7_9FLAO|nr:energy transducer TonB [Aquimarina algiphila]TSE08270.1 hypothetical protein FOF46_12800 [Aquimarina algiphila]